MISSHTATYREPRHMHGVLGVLYVLENSSLRSGYCKIGITRRSGWVKAMELNRDINNIIPGSFACVFELRARDSGAALEEVFRELHDCRRGKKDQNFFDVERGRLEQTLLRAIELTDQQNRIKHYQAQALRRYFEQETEQQEQAESMAAPAGLFRKALRWMVA